jgi:hypothetical protein
LRNRGLRRSYNNRLIDEETRHEDP